MGFRFIDYRMLLPDPHLVPAWFDYGSALIGTSHTLGQVRHAISTLDSLGYLDAKQADNPALALMHEHMHFIQCISTAYMYEWRNEWAALCMDALAKIAPSLEENGFLASWRTNVPSDMKASAMNHLAGLGTAGELKLSTIHLLEGHALFLEAVNHASADTPEQYLRYLNDFAPGPRYRRAYDIMRLWCGDYKTYVLFHGTVMAALSTNDPVKAFEELVFRASRIETDKIEDHQSGLGKIWQDGLKGIEEQIKASRSPSPLSDYALAFISWARTAGAQKIMSTPSLLRNFKEYPPVLCAADDDNRFAVLPGSMSNESSDGLPSEALQRFAYEYSLAAISQGLLHQNETSVGGTELIEQEQYDWLSDLGSTDVVLHVSVDELKGDAGGVACKGSSVIRDKVLQIKDWVENYGSVERLQIGLPTNLIRRVKFSFVTDSAEEVWEIPEVQEFISVLENVMPCFPALLRFEQGESLLLMWFGSLCPDSVAGNGIDMSTVEVRAHVDRLITAIFEGANDSSLNLSPAILATLAPIASTIGRSDAIT